jgi:hypothetical protein
LARFLPLTFARLPRLPAFLAAGIGFYHAIGKRSRDLPITIENLR